MKLWLKVSLISAIMVTAAVSVCSLLMLISAGRGSLNTAVSNAVDNLRLTAASWSTAMQSEIDETYSAVAQRSLARHLIDKFANGNTILISDGDVIYNRSSFEPQERLSLSEEDMLFTIIDADGKTLLISGVKEIINETEYSLYSVSDISSVYTELSETSYRFSIVNFFISLLSAAIVTLISRRLLKPVDALKRNTALIADGVYGRRIEINQQDEIGELAHDFNRMAQAVEEKVMELKEEAERRTLFMSALTHELKTPMTSIKGNAQTLLATKMDEDERQDALLRIDDECSRIERLSGKLMQLIVLRENGELNLKKQSVSALFETVETSCSKLLEDRGLSLSVYNGMDCLYMDADLMSALIINLVDNAGKASQRGGVISLRAENGAISVSDSGCGIPAEELHKITRPFYRADKSRSRKTGGMGLGLALCEEIARLHSARLEFESAPGKGTTARVVLKNED